MPRSAHLVAYDAARLRLQHRHPEEFQGLLNEERAKVGLPPTNRKTPAQKIAALEEQLRALRGA